MATWLPRCPACPQAPRSPPGKCLLQWPARGCAPGPGAALLTAGERPMGRLAGFGSICWAGQHEDSGKEQGEED